MIHRPFAAFCINLGAEEAVALQMGKVMECGEQCARPQRPLYDRDHAKGFF